MGLQHAVQHHRQAVQRDLRREDDQHAGGDGREVAGGAPLHLAGEQLDHRMRGEGGDDAQRHEQHQHPGEQGGGGPSDLGPGPRRLGGALAGLRRSTARGPGLYAHADVRGERAGRRSGEHGHDHAGQRAPHDDLEDDVRHLVGREVGRGQAVRADRAGEHQLLGETDHPGQDRDDPDQDRRRGDALAHPSDHHARRIMRGGGPACRDGGAPGCRR